MRIFKIVHRDEWRGAQRSGEYRGSAKDRADGFLHFSSARQIPGTLARYYAGMGDLLLVCVDADRLGSSLKYEAARDGDLYPHLYGPLAIAATMWTKPIVLHADGSFDLPAELDASDA